MSQARLQTLGAPEVVAQGLLNTVWSEAPGPLGQSMPPATAHVGAAPTPRCKQGSPHAARRALWLVFACRAQSSSCVTTP